MQKNDFKNKIASFIVDDLDKRKLFSFLPDRFVFTLDYLLMFGKFPDIKNPKTFSEKIQWIKLSVILRDYSGYVDKYAVRSFIEKTIGKKYLVPLYGVWNSFDDIDFGKLPRQFVLKGTHGSAYNFICKNKSEIDFARLGNNFKRFMCENFYKKTREKQYDKIKPRIIAEKYLEDETGQLTDYKILCFKGKPYAIEVHLERYTNHRTVFMDPNWKKLNVRISFEPPVKADDPPKPKNLTEMLKIAEKLSKDFPFVRVDLYSVYGKIYFSELTFTPNSGYLPMDPPEMDYTLGRLLDLSSYSKK